jgi:tetratricopeptide (TPR) repeat protein
MNDPVDQFLTTDFSAASTPGLRQAVFAQTARVLRRRRVGRRLAALGALAACFLAGMATMLAWQTHESPRELAQLVPPNENHAAKQPDKPVALSTKHEEAPSLVELEWRAFDSRDNRAALFFDVAQRYLEEQKDYEAALRCYRQALDAAPREVLAIRPDDNWLVMALKEARQKEKNDAVLSP